MLKLFLLILKRKFAGKEEKASIKNELKNFLKKKR